MLRVVPLQVPEHRLVRISLASFAFASVLAVPAFAADLPAPPPMEPVAAPVVVQSGWMVTVGARILVSPSWPGSADYSIYPLPYFSFRDPNSPLIWGSPDDGTSIALYSSEWLRVGIVGGFEGSRDRHDDKKLRGLKTIDWAIEAGGFVEIWPVEWMRGRAEIRRSFFGGDGWVADIGLDGVFKYNPWTFAVGPRVSFATEEYMRTYFGITNKEANKSKVFSKSYRPDGGLKSAGAAASISYDWDNAWSATVFGGWNKLLGDAEKSPIVRKIGDDNQFFGGLAVSYTFNFTP
jgi:outer membrane protein